MNTSVTAFVFNILVFVSSCFGYLAMNTIVHPIASGTGVSHSGLTCLVSTATTPIYVVTPVSS